MAENVGGHMKDSDHQRWWWSVQGGGRGGWHGQWAGGLRRKQKLTLCCQTNVQFETLRGWTRRKHGKAETKVKKETRMEKRLLIKTSLLLTACPLPGSMVGT